jgi:carbonic anhydrase/acetyltransferase-like protein (isoleucine patch superfamily)
MYPKTPAEIRMKPTIRKPVFGASLINVVRNSIGAQLLDSTYKSCLTNANGEFAFGDMSRVQKESVMRLREKDPTLAMGTYLTILQRALIHERIWNKDP